MTATAAAKASWAAFVRRPRVRLGTLPTPLHPAPRLSEAVGVEIWLKRDDLTGLGLGGNKVRVLEFVLGDAEQRGADTLITGGGPSSNWVMLAALAARTRGLHPILVIYGDPVPLVGNLALAELAGAEIVFTGESDRASVERHIDVLAGQLRAQGRNPYLVGRGGATGVGALGYVAATLELVSQTREQNLTPRQIWVATGSCGTQAGLVAGQAWQQPGWAVHGVSVSRPVAECVQRVWDIGAQACALLEVAAWDSPPIVHPDAGDAEYGKRSAAADTAAELVARTEGVFLDPVFAAKAMAGLLAAAAAGQVSGPVIFLVTGGAPTLFTVG
ncbi:MAG TPA: pyridoxal-phosphate dependent enzyme [Sporichthyaceae bacterium]|jgi:D-cysteine desulfhydrase